MLTERSSRYRVTRNVIVLVVSLLALSQSVKAQRTAARPFAERFRILDSVVLRSTATYPIARISGIAVTADGRFVVADISEGTVRLYRRNGEFEAQLGGKGAGPGEFRAPVLPRIDARGRVHVPDIGLLRVTVLDLPAPQRAGGLIRTVPIGRAIRALFGFELAPSGDYIVSGSGESPKQALFVLDSAGNLKVSVLDIREYVRGPAVEAGVWQAVTVTSVATNGLSAFVTLSTFDSLWTVDLTTRKVTASAVPLPDYKAPKAPDKPFASREERRNWSTSQNVTTVFASKDHLFVPMFHGVYNEGLVSDVAYRRSGQPWVVYHGMPTILSIVGDTVFALRSAGDDATIIRVLIRK